MTDKQRAIAFLITTVVFGVATPLLASLICIKLGFSFPDPMGARVFVTVDMLYMVFMGTLYLVWKPR